MGVGSWVWIGVVVIAIAGILGIVIILTKRPVDLYDLGAVSKQWIAQNHVDSP